jgi:lyso-ornithine lipid O-acyltransferase
MSHLPDPLRAVLRTLLLVLQTLVLVPLFLVVRPFGARPAVAVARLWFRGFLVVAGVRVDIAGDPGGERPTLYVPNHVSYLDVVILGARVSACFTAKSEVASWPLFGAIGKLGRTIFLRRRRMEARRQRDLLARHLDAGDDVVLFAEGTSSDGMSVLPFKTSLLGVAEPGITPRPIRIQPVSLVYLQLSDGTPLAAVGMDRYAWYGDATLLPHLWRVLRLPGCVVELRFHPPVPSETVGCRKALAREVRAVLVDEIERAHGRLAPAARQSPLELARSA